MIRLRLQIDLAAVDVGRQRRGGRWIALRRTRWDGALADKARLLELAGAEEGVYGGTPIGRTNSMPMPLVVQDAVMLFMRAGASLVQAAPPSVNLIYDSSAPKTNSAGLRDFCHQQRHVIGRRGIVGEFLHGQ